MSIAKDYDNEEKLHIILRIQMRTYSSIILLISY